MEDKSVSGDGNAASRPPTTVASIVTWNHAHCIEACIQSLLAQTHSVNSIVVYDNASSDGTVEVLGKFKDRITVHRGAENRGFCGGHNFVLSHSTSKFVLLVNPDVVLNDDYVEIALRRMSQDKKIGTVCGLLLQDGANPGTSLIDGTGLTVAKSRRFLLRHHGVTASTLTLQAGEVFGCDGALPFYRRELIDNIANEGQFFDEMFFAHKEDHDVSWRAQIFGWKTVFDPKCIAVHPRVFRPGNLELRKNFSPEIKYHAVKNDLLLLLKNESPANFMRDIFSILPRRLGILVFAMLMEQYSLRAYGFVFRNWGQIMKERKRIQQAGAATSGNIRNRFALGAVQN